MHACLLLALLISQSGADSALLQRARQAVADSQISTAVALAERYIARRSRDPEGFIVLGDARARQFPAGRFAALNAYRQAQRLAPDDVRSFARESDVGFMLGGGDGARIARQALERVLKLDPYYPGAWERWLVFYRNAGGRERMIDLLRKHQPTDTLRLRLAAMLIEEERYDEADGLLDSVLARRPQAVELLALRAQSAYEQGDTVIGTRYYHRAVSYAATDTTGALWRQIIGIATPDEITAWPGVAPHLRGRWLSSFWARRNPDLFRDANARIAEHFTRWRHARKHYPVQHPLVTHHRSPLGRSLNLEPSQTERALYLRCEVFQITTVSSGLSVPLPGVIPAEDRARMSMGVLAHLMPEELEAVKNAVRSADSSTRIPNIVRRAMQEDGPLAFTPTVFAPLGLDLRSVDSVAARIGYNLATRLDDRGTMYLRFGAPDQLLIGSDNGGDPACVTGELERWRYDEWGETRFSRPSAFSRGTRNVTEMVFRPMNRRQFSLMERGLTEDATSLPASLTFAVWTAQFRGSIPDATDVIVISTENQLAAALVRELSEGQPVESDSGVASASARPGPAILLVHARRGESLGRLRDSVIVRDFSTAGPRLSDALVAGAWGAAPADRTDMLRRADRDLVFPERSTITTYVEAYGLEAAQGIRRYRVRYSLLRTASPERDIKLPHWPAAYVFEFERQIPDVAGDTQVESLDITPERIPRGTYLLRIELTDVYTGNSASPVTMALKVK